MHVTCWKTTYRAKGKEGHSVLFLQHVAELWSQVSLTYSSNQEKGELLFRSMREQIHFRREGRLGGRSWLLWLYALLTLNGEIKPTIAVYINYICK